MTNRIERAVFPLESRNILVPETEVVSSYKDAVRNGTIVRREPTNSETAKARLCKRRAQSALRK